MEPTYPEIVEQIIKKSRNILGSRSYMFDPDLITITLYCYQLEPTSKTINSSSVDSDIIPLALGIKPLSEWNVTKEQADQANTRRRQKWVEERKQKRERFNQ